MKSVHHDSFRRLGRLAAAWLGVAAVFLAPASALAAQVTLISPTSAGITFTVNTTTGTSTALCPFASVIGDANGNLTFSCTGSTATPAAGTLALNTFGTATGIPVTSGSTTFTVARTGGTTGPVSGNLEVSGGCTLSTDVINFSNGSGVPSPATVTINAASAAQNTSCTVTLTTSSATLGSPSTLNVAITAQSPGTLALSLGGTASSIPVTSGSTTFTVTRNNGTSGAVIANLGVTGGCTLSTNSVSFIDGSTTPSPSSVTLAAGSASGGGSCTVTLTAAGGATAGSPSSHTLSITSDPTPPPPSGCTTNATRTVNWPSANLTQILDSVRANETLAIAVNLANMPLSPTRDFYRMAYVEGGGLSGGADLQITVSNCPGDFAAATRLSNAECMKHSTVTGNGINFRVGVVSSRNAICFLPAGTTTAYFNVRPIKLPTPSPADAPGTASCPAGMDCKFYFSIAR